MRHAPRSAALPLRVVPRPTGAGASFDELPSFDQHEMPTRAYTSSRSGLRSAVTNAPRATLDSTARLLSEEPAELLPDETPTLSAIEVAPALLEGTPLEVALLEASPRAVAPPSAEALAPAPTAPAEAGLEGEFFESSPRYTVTSVAPAPLPTVVQQSPRRIAKWLFVAVGSGVLVLGAVELVLACFR